jgi:hypothetical protein
MAQSALTVTQANPTPPTNLSFVGNTPPLDPAQAVVDDGISKALPNATTTGTDASTINEDKAIVAWPVAITFATSTAAANTGGAPGAGISNTHEARGTETSVTAASANPIQGIGTTVPAQNKMVGVGPAMSLTPPAIFNPNAEHASSLSPKTNLTPTTTGASGASNVSGVGTTLLTVTGTNYNRTSVVYLNGVAQQTNYVSATSLTVTNALKRTTAGTLPVYVINGSSGIQTATVNWTLS